MRLNDIEVANTPGAGPRREQGFAAQACIAAPALKRFERRIHEE
jgi:hypothetical protein